MGDLGTEISNFSSIRLELDIFSLKFDSLGPQFRVVCRELLDLGVQGGAVVGRTLVLDATQLGIDPEQFAWTVLARVEAEEVSIRTARAKVRAKGETQA